LLQGGIRYARGGGLKKAIVVGSGAGGATVAKELQGHFEVTVLEAGKEFRPFPLNLKLPEKIKKTGLLFDEKMIQLWFPVMRISKTQDRMILVKGNGVGGTTTICTGNALRLDADLKKIGIDLDDEFEEIYREIPVTSDHRHLWRATTKKLFEICSEMDLDPQPTPKMGNYVRCRSCGRCVLGCRAGAKWDSRKFLSIALEKGARLMTGCRVEKVIVEGKEAKGVTARCRGRRQFFPADLVVLAAGGFGTPVILQNSGFKPEPRLSVDPVLCVAADWDGSYQSQEISMPFVAKKDHFILSPYFDHLSYFFNKQWKYPAKNIVSMMIKLADDSTGDIDGKKVTKSLTEQDRFRMGEAIALCKDILQRLGVKKKEIFLGTLNAGHPAGMLPLSEMEAKSLHHDRLPENLYIADATLLPNALGKPPILTIIALAKRVSKICTG
jgi:choline dehydrogenase-like flavoprotein